MPLLISPPFISLVLPHGFLDGFLEKTEGGGGYNRQDKLSIFINHRVPEAIFFRGNLVMTTMTGMIDLRGWRRYLAEGWILIFPGGIKTRRPSWSFEAIKSLC
jgi:hypothetical protein